MPKAKDFGSQGKAAPVNTAQPIKAGTPSQSQPGGTVTHFGHHPGGGKNNDSRKAK